jgi:hypothetical protein
MLINEYGSRDHHLDEWIRLRVKSDIGKVYVFTVIGDGEVRIVAWGEGHCSKLWVGNRLETLSTLSCLIEDRPLRFGFTLSFGTPLRLFAFGRLFHRILQKRRIQLGPSLIDILLMFCSGENDFSGGKHKNLHT